MPKYLYSADTTPANGAQISADTGEIVHVHTSSEAEAREYATCLRNLLTDADTTGDLPAELETFGNLHGKAVRVHVSVG